MSVPNDCVNKIHSQTSSVPKFLFFLYGEAIIIRSNECYDGGGVFSLEEANARMTTAETGWRSSSPTTRNPVDDQLTSMPLAFSIPEDVLRALDISGSTQVPAQAVDTPAMHAGDSNMVEVSPDVKRRMGGCGGRSPLTLILWRRSTKVLFMYSF